MTLIDPSAIDVLSNIPYQAGPPHDVYTWLRRNRPLFHQQIDDPITVTESWVVTRHADVMAVSRDLDHYGNFAGHNLRNDHDKSVMTHLLLEDRPKHTDMRLMASRSFTPRVVRQYAEHYQRLAGRLLGQALDRANGDTFDLVEHLSVEFPMQAIVELMGTPLDDNERLLRWSNATISNLDPDYSPTAEARSQALQEMAAYALQLAEQRRESPQDDLATVLTARLDAGELNQAEFCGYVILLFVAGNETTRNNISWGLKALAENPDQWEMLKADPDRHLDNAVEEVTRWASPVNYMSRTVHTEVELHGQTIKPGEKVAMMYLSANRDEEVFDEPFRFDITRDPNPQIAFGYGAHFCMGAHLARLETRAVLSELVERVDRLEITGEVEYVWSSFINGIKTLPIRMT
jgi:cholest-4-en-3-one 26-monooxygenase